jgi:hypothetical protein
MNTLSGKKLFLAIQGLALVGFGMAVPSAEALTSPASMSIRVYEVRVSHNADCSNPIRVISNPGGTVQDFVTNPNLGSGAIPNGSYPCIMTKIGNLITYTPAANDGLNCVAGTSYTRNVFHTGGGDDTSANPDGGTISAIGTSQDTTSNPFWAYFKVGGGANGCKTPATACTLSSPIIVSGDKTGTLVVDFDNKIDGSASPCDMQAPVFSYR